MSTLKYQRFCVCEGLVNFVILIGNVIFALFSGFFRCFISKPRRFLQDEIVLITGSANGLGRETALRFSDMKATVVLWDIDETGLRAVEREIREKNGKAHAYVCDVSSESEVFRVGRLVQEEVGDVTILLNNAGILQNLPFLELDSNRIRKTFDVNILAHFWTIRCFLPKMLEMEKGHIAAISSGGGLVGWLYMGDYGATKFAVVGMMEVLEEEIRAMGREDQIHFTTVCPFDVDTGINKNPTCRLPSLLPMLDVKYAAREIVTAIQRNERLLTLPRKMLYPVLLGRLAPRRVIQLIVDYFNYNVLPNDFEAQTVEIV